MPLAVLALGAVADGAGTVATGGTDAAGGPAPATVPSSFAWTGPYIGGHVAERLALADDTLSAPAPARSTDALGSLFGGVQLGYNLQLPSRVLVGIEGDISFPYFVQDGVVMSRGAPQGSVTEKLDFLSTLRARVGYAWGRWLTYGTGGLTWSQVRLSETPGLLGGTGAALRWPIGWTVGAGAELALSRAWSLKGEYLFAHVGDVSGGLAPGTGFASSIDSHTLQLGLNWHFRMPGESAAPGTSTIDAWPFRSDAWNLHGQATVVEQGYFSFRSPYEGPNSLSGNTQFQDTVSATAFLGVRAWAGAEAYFNPEVDQGYGLSHALGVAAFPNGEAQKASYPVPRLNVDRLMIRQTFGLGGEQEVVRDGPNELPGRRDVSRVTVTAGRLSVGDAFGRNTYADDPRTGFMNWNLYGSGSYDWTMDQPGFTWGGLVELNEKRWALRVGYFLEPTHSNGNTFDLDIPTRGQYLAEPELRYAVLSQPGVLRVMGWVTRASMGSYAEAVAMPLSTAGYPDITRTREVRATYGVVVNVEQALSRDLGVFSRASWTPGLVEVMGWTECDESVSLGAVLSGTVWRRPDDRVGLAGVIEGLSASAREYFAAGGLGVLIGDGRLTYRPEQVLEAYYAVSLSRWATLTLDFQYVDNPAYNADRGPVPIYAGRLHVEL